MAFPVGWAGYCYPNGMQGPASTLVDFLYIVDLADMHATWWSNVRTDGGDIRVTLADGTQVACHLLRFDHTAQEGLLAFTYVGNQGTSPGLPRIWCGNSTATLPANTDTYGQYNSYRTGLKAFYVDGRSPDATVSQNTLVGSPTDPVVAGPFTSARATYHDGTTQLGHCTGANVPTGEPLTLIVVARPTGTSLSSSRCLLSINNGSINVCRDLNHTSSAVVRALSYSNPTARASTAGTATVNTWYHHAGVFTTAPSRTAYNNGATDGANTQSVTVSGLNRLTVGGRYTGIPYLGDLSMVRAYSEALSVDELNYDADMLLDPGTFYGTWTWQAANTPPVLDLVTTSDTYLPSQGEKILWPSATISDVDGDVIQQIVIPLFNGAVEEPDKASAVITVNDVSFAFNETSVSDTTTINGATIEVALIDETLFITENADNDITMATAQAIIRLVKYDNNATSPTPGVRQFSVQAFGTDGDSNAVTYSLNVLAELTAVGITVTPVGAEPMLAVYSHHTATGITATPAVGVPAMGQKHVLGATGITAGPVVATPVVGQKHVLTATGTAIGAPVLSNTSIGQKHVLVSLGIATEAPTRGSPAISQKHVLTANAITTTPVVGNPTLTILGPPTLSLGTSDGNHLGYYVRGDEPTTMFPAPDIGDPGVGLSYVSIVASGFLNSVNERVRVSGWDFFYGFPDTQVIEWDVDYNVAFDGEEFILTKEGGGTLTSGSLETFLLSWQNYNLANPLTEGARQFHVTVFAPGGLSSETKYSDILHLNHHYSFSAVGIVTDYPTLGSPVLTEVPHLIPTGITVGPIVGTPLLNMIYHVTADGIETGAPVFSEPTLTSGTLSLHLGDNDGNYQGQYIVGLDPVAITGQITIEDPAGLGIDSMLIAISDFHNGNGEIINIGGTDFPVATNASATVTAGSTDFAVNLTDSLFTITKSGGGKIPVADLKTLIEAARVRNIAWPIETGPRTLVYQIDADSATAWKTATVTHYIARLPRKTIDTTLPSHWNAPADHTVTTKAELQAILDAPIAPATVIEIAPGTEITGPLFVRAHCRGTLGQEIIIRTTATGELPPHGTRLSANAEQHLPIIQSVTSPTTSGAAIYFEHSLDGTGGASYIRFIGICFQVGSEGTPGVAALLFLGARIDELSVLHTYMEEATAADANKNIIFNHCITKGKEYSRCGDALRADGAEVAYVDGRMYDIHGGTGGTNQTDGGSCVRAYNAEGPIVIRNNFLSCTGITVMFGDNAYREPRPSDIWILYNHFWRNPKWEGDGTWNGKNHHETKNSEFVLLMGNVYENGWDDDQEAASFYPKNSAPGTRSNHQTFTRNLTMNSYSAFRISGDATAEAPSWIDIYNNLFYDMDEVGQYTSGMQYTRVRHNTVHQHPAGLGNRNPSLHIVTTAQWADIRDNIIDTGLYRFKADGTNEGTTSLNKLFTNYHFTHNAVRGVNLNWLNNGAEVGSVAGNNYSPSSSDAIGYVSIPNKDFSLSASSPYKNAASDGTDIGADVAAVLAEVEGVREIWHTPDRLWTGAPTVGNPTLAGVGSDNLTADSLHLPEPTTGTPSLGQTHVLTTPGITATPVLGPVTLKQIHPLVATGISTSVLLPTLSITQKHVLVVSEILTIPVLGNPILSGSNTVNFTATSLSLPGPTTGTPEIGQIHVLVANEITVTPIMPLVGTGQIYTLIAAELVSAAPILSSPLLNTLIPWYTVTKIRVDKRPVRIIGEA